MLVGIERKPNRGPSTSDFETQALTIARARIVLCLLVLLSIYVDPATGGLFGIARSMLVTLAANLVYGAAAYLLARRSPVTRRFLGATAALDIVFAAILAFFTEGPTSPAFAMFLFAIIATGSWAEFSLRVIVTAVSVFLYLLALFFSETAISKQLLMRAVYLGIAGYLIDFFGRKRDEFEFRLRDLEAETERQTIARSLHDGFLQALAGINLRLETCRDMLTSNQSSEALGEITEIQTCVAFEYDEVRKFLRSLARADRGLVPVAPLDAATEFRVETAFVGRGPVVEHIIQILLEGIRNTQRHAHARFARIKVEQASETIRIAIDDDGVGFTDFNTSPWTIASRVAEFGGRLAIRPGTSAGSHLEIELPSRT
jgi:signal transduction histidine kinase